MILPLLLAATISVPGALAPRTSPHISSDWPSALAALAPRARMTGASAHAQTLRRRTHGALSRSSIDADSLDVAMYALLLRSADRRSLDTALIASAFASPNSEMRRAAARTLSQVALHHRARSLPLLRIRMRDPDSVVAAAAGLGLGLLKDTASVPLLASVVRVGGSAAPSAAWALGEIGAPARDTLSVLLGSHHDGRQPAIAMALLLAESKMRPLDVAAVAPFVSARDTTVRWAAAYAIARQRNPAGAHILLDATNPNAAFRAELARELSVATAGDSLRERASARLRVLATDSDPFVRVNAIRSAGTYGASMRPALVSALRDRDANVRVAAAQSAGPVFGSSAAEWIDAWKLDTGYMYRKSLLGSAASVGFSLPAAAEWRASPDWKLRHAAIAAWTGSPDTMRVRALATDMMHDSDARVRLAAFNLIASTDTAHADSVVQRALLAARNDPDSLVRKLLPGSRVRTFDTALVARPATFYESVVRRVVLPTLAGRPPRAELHTARGRIVVTFNGVEAPLTVANYLALAGRHYYDNLGFHRVVPAFVAQDGDPRGDGEGGPGYAIRDELTLLPYSRGAVGMALSGPDTGGSQYFLTLTPQPHLAGHYTVFGRVTSGFDAMDALVEGDAIRRVVSRR